MTEKRLKEIEARVAAAAEGPWERESDPRELYCGIVNIHANTVVEWGCWENDAEFIAHARQDVPDLLVHIRNLEDQVERFRKLVTRDLSENY